MKELTIINKNFLNLPTTAFENFSFYDLNLSSNNISEIDFDCFRKASVTKLILDYNRLSNIGFYLWNLKSLSVQANKLITLKKSSFSGLPELEMLYISNNSISSIEPMSFSNNKKLNYMDISNNKLKSICKTMFVGLIKLEKLYLNENEITEIEGNTFEDNRDLKEISLDLNGLSELRFLNCLTSLGSLSIQQNYKQTVLKNQSFSGLTKLLTLKLGFNSISIIESGAFLGFRRFNKFKRSSDNIDYSDIFDNKFDSNKDNENVYYIQKLGILKFLYLNSNKLRSIRSGTFNGLVSLTNVNLEKNEIAEI
jgi:Leucine-rich repeat (LRR) protein